jgi:phospholipid/cholesterol/gamma-HCH transport system permease protein
MTTTALARKPGWIETIGRITFDAVSFVGDMALFCLETFLWTIRRPQSRHVLLPALYQTGVSSVNVVIVTGAFIGMVLSVQSYQQLKSMHLESTIGTVVNFSLVRELGPVLAATMLAGRVGCAMAAEIGTMKVTEQIDALRMLGANPIHYLVVPRFLACFLLIPLLSIIADAAGIAGGWFFSVQVLGVPDAHYWFHTEDYVTLFDIISGTTKSFFFGGAISIVACHRGFHCDAGAEGVGRAATEAFVYSFVAILALDFLLAVLLDTLNSLAIVLGWYRAIGELF